MLAWGLHHARNGLASVVWELPSAVQYLAQEGNVSLPGAVHIMETGLCFLDHGHPILSSFPALRTLGAFMVGTTPAGLMRNKDGVGDGVAVVVRAAFPFEERDDRAYRQASYSQDVLGKVGLQHGVYLEC